MPGSCPGPAERRLTGDGNHRRSGERRIDANGGGASPGHAWSPRRQPRSGSAREESGQQCPPRRMRSRFAAWAGPAHPREAARGVLSGPDGPCGAFGGTASGNAARAWAVNALAAGL